MVSPSMLGSLPIVVAPALKSTGSPHDEQNLPVEETCAPQEEQNMGGRDSIIAPRRIAKLLRKFYEETRSTCTAVP
jgi:hypothetical protein